MRVTCGEIHPATGLECWRRAVTCDGFHLSVEKCRDPNTTTRPEWVRWYTAE